MNEPVPDQNNASVVRVWNVSNLEGILLTFIESLGLSESQERASKSILRNTLWDWQRNLLPVRDSAEKIGFLEYVVYGSGVSTDTPVKKKK